MVVVNEKFFSMIKTRLVGNGIYKIVKHGITVVKNCIPYHLRWYHFIGVFVVSATLITLRRPDIFLYPQFWAEDGGYWFKDAYNGQIFASLFTPMAGYLQTISRLAGAVTTLFPLSYAPLVFNVLAITIKILPILFILSERFRSVIPSLKTKIALIAMYIALPNTNEVFVNITNAHWHLALLSILILMAKPSENKWWKIFDGFFVALMCLSGPFCIFMIPAALLRYIYSPLDERKRLRYIYIIFSFFTGVQLITMVAGNVLGARQIQENRYSLDAFIKLVAGQIYIASLVGEKGYAFFLEYLQHVNVYIRVLFMYLIFVVGTAIMTFSFLKNGKELKAFVIFCVSTFAFSLVRPMVIVTGELSQWQIMTLPGNATRYYFLPMLAFLVSVIALFSKKNSLQVKLLGVCISLVFIVGVVFEFFYPPWPNYYYQDQVRAFEQQPVGSFADIQIVPSIYKMRLYKK